MTRRRVGDRYVLARPDLGRFLDAVRASGYAIVGPTIRDGAIVYGPIQAETDLPIGWTDRQDAGRYRLERRTDEAVFGYNVGPHSWKKYLFPAHERLFTAEKSGDSFTVAPEPAPTVRYAFLGVRACELAAIGVQDRVFLGGAVDPGYRARREHSLRIAVQCGQAGGTCFCTSMGTGPGVRSGHDLALTELLTDGPHRFLVEVGSEAGAAVLAGVPLTEATEVAVHQADALVARTEASMGRALDVRGIRELLIEHPKHPEWDRLGQRCLGCANCTLACPTCFCSTTEEVPDLDGDRVERWRRWDSCFQPQFTELHHTSVRSSISARYRQWLTHKLASWHDQFGQSGCVGCGRCITWCPVGIDLTEAAAAIRAAPEQTAAGRAP